MVHPFYVDSAPSTQVWYFNSTTRNSTSIEASSCSCKGPSPTITIAGSTAGSVVALLLIVIAFWFGMRRGKASSLGGGQPQEKPSSPVSSPVEVSSSNILHHPQSDIRASIAGSPTAASITSGNVISPQPHSAFHQVCDFCKSFFIVRGFADCLTPLAIPDAQVACTYIYFYDAR